ncbi:hypothetical protein PCASD_01837 [Puccinia coronata f. sp. avenae]|uniref:No apical meristem-associated C-terminal domain-containing protein n=1 Tax=Puccinia coronata f. sp. avenae TaxID=200324 RepID=A0A2N5VJC4_9BASI|nr:hypothetical protein PCASD_01837 [Puccinia coronata f. sp. avenae]
MDCQLVAGVDLWQAKLPKVAAKGRIGPPRPLLAACVAALLEAKYTSQPTKVCSRLRDGSSVGDALTPEDQQTGIQTIEQKLNSLCPHYQVMHELMGNKAFVNPLYKVDAQKDVETTNPSDSDNSDDSDDSDNSDNGKDKDSDDVSVHLEDKDPESQTQHTDPALDPELLDYNPQNQQRPTTSPKNKPQKSTQRKRKQNTWYCQRRDALTAEERALDSSSSDQSLSSEVIIPTNSPKKKTKNHKKKKANANELATHPSPAQTPQNSNKGKQRACNSNNINPRSHSTPASKNNNVFAQYDEYALKRDAGKAQVAQASLDFQINKYQHQLAIDNKMVKLEEKKFMRSSQLEEKKWH